MILENPNQLNRSSKYLSIASSLYAKKKVRVYTEIVITILTINFFIFFAIKPTLLTVTGLLKETKDKRVVVEKLDKKISDLVAARNKYNLVESNLDLVEEALPKDNNLTLFIKQIEALARKEGVIFESFQVNGLSLKSKTVLEKEGDLTFAMTVSGEYEQLVSYLHSLNDLRRPMLVDNFNFAQDEKAQKLRLIINAKTHYLRED